MSLSLEQIEFYKSHGYLSIPNYWDADTVSSLRERIAQIISNYGDLTQLNASIFTTKEQSRDDASYFLESGDKISYFWEENSRDIDGKFIQSPEQSINKIGHALHDLDPVFQKASYTPDIRGICRDLGLKRPMSVQSMYIFKQPRIGGEVGAHQDGAFLYTEPQSVLGFWWALDDCTVTNGCLWVVPGSHVLPVTRKFRRKTLPSIGTEFSPAEATPFDLTGAIPVECPKGTLILIHSSLVHYSEENKSPFSRHAYSIHVIEGDSSVTYPPDNWLQRSPETPFQFIEF
jgi:phytanoyl-CoA hydroxylase